MLNLFSTDGNPDVKDKPEILVLRKHSNATKCYFNVCHFGKNNSLKKFTLINGEIFPREFDYDSRTRTLYAVKYESNIQISNISVDDGEFTTIFQSSGINGYEVIHFVTLDWVSKNIYFIEGQSVKILRLEGGSKNPKTLFTLKKNPQYYPEMKVFPNQGYLIVKTSCKHENFFSQFIKFFKFLLITMFFQLILLPDSIKMDQILWSCTKATRS